MKIIKPGLIQPQVYVGKCWRCGCEIEAQKKEVKHNAGAVVGQRTPTDGHPFDYVVCPTKHCGTDILVTEKK